MLSRTRLAALVNQADFQGSRATQNIFGLGSVLHARQLHHNAVKALLLNDRFGHTQLVDSVVQGGDVLLQGLFLNAARSVRFEIGRDFELAAIGCIKDLQVGKLIGHDPACGIQLGLVANFDFNTLAVACDATMADIFFTQCGANVACQ